MHCFRPDIIRIHMKFVKTLVKAKAFTNIAVGIESHCVITVFFKCLR